MINELTPRKIVEELDKYIIGQAEAKKAVAIAIRNRARRMLAPEDIKEEIYPKNIIMIGSTGIGKTEIARRLAKLVDAPFIKVEASKYTEVGYVGRDVESMIRDLVEISVNKCKAVKYEEYKQQAKEQAEEALLKLLLPDSWDNINTGLNANEDSDNLNRLETTRDKLRKKLREGKLENRLVEIEVKENIGTIIGGVFPSGAGFEELGIDMKDVFEKMLPPKKKLKKITVAEARPILETEAIEQLIDMESIVSESIKLVEQSGIIFLDEIDKIVAKDSHSGPDVSRGGVQRDLLPIIEGSTVITKYGMVRTDHILFVAAGAFHSVKPSDLIPEFQGRFPIRVELKSLTEQDFVRILKETKNSLLVQYKSLLSTENIKLEFSNDAIKQIAKISAEVNEKTEDIGARRLHTVLERLLEDISFEAPERAGEKIIIDSNYVKEKLQDIVENVDLSRYIL